MGGLLVLVLALSFPLNVYCKQVFAHYMVCCPSYNSSVQGFVADIQEAQAYGIDGFALNAGAWSNAYYYVEYTTAIYQAALQLNSNFLLFMSADMSGITNSSDIIDMIARFYDHPNQFKYEGKSVLSTYSGTASPWWIGGAFYPLKNMGMEVYFIPDFSPVQYLASFDAQDYSYQNYLWDFYVQGLFNFAAAQLYDDEHYTGLIVNSAPIQSLTRYRADVAHKYNKTVMSGLNPHYWGSKQSNAGRRYFEYGGGESLSSQWESIIQRNNPEWVEIVTWNDLDEEGYVTPLEAGELNPWVFQFSAHQAGDGNTSLNYYPSHRGTLGLISYFISWFKNGAQPSPASDTFYWFYRKHPWQARATDDPFGPVTYFIGQMNDTIYITSILTSPAELLVECGSQSTTLPLPAGLYHSRAPFAPGLPKFTLSRNNQVILQAQGSDQIEAEPKYYNFHYSSNFASLAQPSVIPAPSGLTGTAGYDWVTLTWEAYESASGYIVKSSENATGNFDIILKTTSTYANISSLHTNTTLYFTVAAILPSGKTTSDSAPLLLTPNNLPDLVVTALSLNPPNPTPGQPFTANATITNIGNGPLTLPLVVFFEVDVNPGGYLYNNPPFEEVIGPGESVQIAGNDFYYGGKALWTAWGPLVHTVKAVVNPFPPGYVTNIFPNSKVVETNYSNNYMVVDLKILPDLAFGSVSTSPSSPTSGQNAVINVDIVNEGLVTAENGTFVVFTNNGAIFANISVPVNIPVGANFTTSSPTFSWPSSGWDTLLVYVNLYPFPVYAEMSFANNVYPQGK